MQIVCANLKNPTSTSRSRFRCAQLAIQPLAVAIRGARKEYKSRAEASPELRLIFDDVQYVLLYAMLVQSRDVLGTYRNLRDCYAIGPQDDIVREKGQPVGRPHVHIPQNPRLCLLAAIVHFLLGDANEACACLDGLARGGAARGGSVCDDKEVRDTVAWATYCRPFFKMGTRPRSSWPSALASASALEEVSDWADGHPPCAYLEGFMLYLKGEWSSAAQHFETCASRHGYRPISSLNMNACTKANANQPWKAIRLLCKAMSLGGDASAAHNDGEAVLVARYNLAILQARLDRADTACASLKALLSDMVQRHNGEPEPRVRNRPSLVVSMDGNTMMCGSTSAVSAAPSRKRRRLASLGRSLGTLSLSKVRRRYAKMLASRGAWAEAKAAYGECCGDLGENRSDIDGSSALIHSEYILVLLKLGRLQEASEWVQHSISVWPNVAELRLHQAELHLRFRDPRKAIDCADRAIELAGPRSAADTKAKQRRRARGSDREIAWRRPANNGSSLVGAIRVQAMNTKALAHVVLGNVRAAIEALTKAVSIQPHYQTVFNLSVLLLRNGDVAGSIAHWFRHRDIPLDKSVGFYESELKQRQVQKAELTKQGAGVHASLYRTDADEMQAVSLDCHLLRSWLRLRSDRTFEGSFPMALARRRRSSLGARH